MTRPAGLYVFGFGGHARSVGDIALAIGIEGLAFVDDSVRPGETFGSYLVLAGLPGAPKIGWVGFPAIGDNEKRRALYYAIALPMPALIAPTSSVGRFTAISPAVLIAHQAHVGPLVQLGCGVIVNSGAIVEHETLVGDFSHIAVHATVAGRCRIGSRVFVGAGATIIDGISVADGVIIGAGATVVRDIGEPGVYVGTPARLLQS